MTIDQARNVDLEWIAVRATTRAHREKGLARVPAELEIHSASAAAGTDISAAKVYVRIYEIFSDEKDNGTHLRHVFTPPGIGIYISKSI